MLKRLAYCLLIALAPITLAAPAKTTIPTEKATVEVLPPSEGKPWFWVWGNRAPAQIDGRAFLFDESGKTLGQLNTGFWFNSLLPLKARNELVTVETYFTRGLRGERTDVVTLYDPRTLSSKREIAIPSKRIHALGSTGLGVTSDDERFLLILNYTPAQSISIVDLQAGKFVGEVETPGCASIYPAGKRDFYSICGDGGFMHLRLDESGRVILRDRTKPLFDPGKDWLSTSASRIGNTWYFVSRDNFVHPIEMTPAHASVAARWPLVTDSERKDDWRISGIEHTAVHRASGRLFVLMHQGPPESKEDPGTEVWVYDVKTRQRISRIEMNQMTISIGVSQGPSPRLYTVDFFVPMPYLAMMWVYLREGQDGIMKAIQQCISIYDAGSGKHLRQIDGLPAGYLSVVLPW